MDVLGLKILFLFVILTTSSIFGMTPVLFGKLIGRKFNVKTSTKKKWLSIASCFGAGVFLYVAFLGLLPEADRKFHKIMKEVENNGYVTLAEFPWPYLIVVCGFLLIFTVDKVVHAIDETKNRKKSCEEYIPLKLSSENAAVDANKVNGGLTVQENVVQISNHHHKEEINVGAHAGVPSSLIILIALCMHAIFEGMAVGLQTSKENVLSFSIAIIIHESVMALTFGLTVAKGAISRCKKIIYVLIFAASIPSGIAIGIAMREGESDITYIISAVFEALAPGIFIHVIFIEILGSEFSHTHDDSDDGEEDRRKEGACDEILNILTKILSIVLGFILIVVVNLLTPHID